MVFLLPGGFQWDIDCLRYLSRLLANLLEYQEQYELLHTRCQLRCYRFRGSSLLPPQPSSVQKRAGFQQYARMILKLSNHSADRDGWLSLAASIKGLFYTEYHMSGVCTNGESGPALTTRKKQTNVYNRSNPRFCRLFLNMVHTWLFDTAMTSCCYIFDPT